MNKHQKAILANLIGVVVVTALAVTALINFKDWVNHTEAMRAIEHLNDIVRQYRQNYGTVPPESYIDSVKIRLPGYVRLGSLHYRARWVDTDSPPDEILAYVERNYHSLIVSDGVIVLRLNGSIEFMDKKEFKTLLAYQQTAAEMQFLGAEIK